VCGFQYEVPLASDRSVVSSVKSALPGPKPRRRQVSQSCGSATAATRAAFSGSASRSQRSFVAVNDATGREPVRSTMSGNSWASCAAASAERVSFQSRAGRMTVPSSPSTTMPCCCPAIDTAATSSSPPAAAIAS
jgi:hypothetical protein